MERLATRPPEMWAGLECTFNRVQDRFADQCVLNGHDSRVEADLERFASLGVKRLRYPVLWEKIAPHSPDSFRWEATDKALAELRRHGVSPIAGLVHHGSGPLYTSLLDPEFPEKLARFAEAVATRYPWIDAYTPVNEPLTTARFSCLYGFWYPHRSDDESFVRALYHELKGTVLAMQAIRKINPHAKLVQTDDLGFAKGTPQLSYQVEFENARRWLTFDLLCGKIDQSHFMFDYLRDLGGLSAREIAWFENNSLPPDIIGINHYPLSNRFLDHRIELYPREFHGGNGREVYADVGAVDTGQTEPPMPDEIFRQVWERYGLPFAVTEAHISGPREMQMRWLNEIWNAANIVRAEGANLLAVTAWSLLGSYGWTSLCTCAPGDETYESGVYDLTGGEPQETELVHMIRAFARGESFDHPHLEANGYWREPGRVRFAHADSTYSVSQLQKTPTNPQEKSQDESRDFFEATENTDRGRWRRLRRSGFGS